MIKDYKTKKDLVIEIIRDAILSGELEPGDRLLQVELAERLNVSSTPVREALQQLEAEGVLVRSPHKGVRVADIKLEDTREMYLIRSVLEALATRLAVPKLDDSDIEQLRALQVQFDAQIATGQLTELRKLNLDFHMAIYKAAGMPYLYNMISSLWAKFPEDTLYVLSDRAPISAAEHRRIIQAIEDRDAEKASQLMQEHLEHGSLELTKYLARSKEKDMLPSNPLLSDNHSSGELEPTQE